MILEVQVSDASLFRCSRTACKSQRAECWHSQTWNLYCVRCAKKINEANPHLVVMWVPSSGGFVSSDGKYVLSEITALCWTGLPKWVLYYKCGGRVLDLGDHFFRHAAAKTIQSMRIK